MIEKRKIALPKASGNTEEVEVIQSLLLIGANGSGKTRMGAWIEIDSPYKERVHRISAQKSLAMPDSATPVSIDIAKKNLWYGSVRRTPQNKHLKWDGKPAVLMQSDFDKLLVYLFSEQTEINAKYIKDSKQSISKVEPPVTKLDKVKEVWEKILPHRKLVVGGLNIQTKVKGGNSDAYKSSEMSDGERVIFYLIGQCLAAPKDGIIVIDEPELHLHKSVQAPLWAEVEKLRSDCLFVYLTHDVDFAAAKNSATKVWLRSFDGKSWEWELLEPTKDLPEELALEILGSRKPIVFVEGTKDSYDYSLYAAVLPDFLVMPVGSCTQVIQTVKALKANTQFHHLKVYGLIDRDRRVPEEINSLEEGSIFVLKVAEVENLFCVKEVLEIVSNLLSRNPSVDFQNVSNTAFSRLAGEMEAQVSLRVSNEIRFLLNMFDSSKKGAQEISDSLEALTSRIDVNKIYSDTEQYYQKILDDKNYNGFLEVFNGKSFATQISGALGLANGKLPETIVNLVNGSLQKEISTVLKPYFGSFQEYMQ